MTGPDHYQPAPNDGDQIKHRVVRRLEDAQLDIVAACTTAGCRVESLLGEGELTFEEAVGLAHVLGCSPAVFFDPSSGLKGTSDTPSDTPGVFEVE